MQTQSHIVLCDTVLRLHQRVPYSQNVVLLFDHAQRYFGSEEQYGLSFADFYEACKSSTELCTVMQNFTHIGQ